jgi:alpha-ribazole phosphatase
VRIFLIRHPPPLIEPGVCYGRLDVDCHAPEPFADALRVRLPAGIAIYSSPLRRALRLARALSPAVRVDARLSEMDFGAWEGRRWDEIGKRETGAWAADVLNFVPPGGESVAALRARVLDFAASLEGDAALVTHAGVMRVLAGRWRRLPEADWPRLEFAFGGMVCFDLVHSAVESVHQ